MAYFSAIRCRVWGGVNVIENRYSIGLPLAGHRRPIIIHLLTDINPELCFGVNSNIDIAVDIILFEESLIYDEIYIIFAGQYHW